MTKPIKWNERPDMVAYMMEIIPGHEEYQIKELFQDKFGILLTESQIGNFKYKHHIRSGTHGGQFKKGQVSPTKGKKMPKEVYEKAKHTICKVTYRMDQIDKKLDSISASITASLTDATMTDA